VEISRSRLRHNIGAVRQVAGADAEVLAVIKADGYGHGAALIAPVLAEAGVLWLGVDDVEEGAIVRQALPQPAAANSPRLLVMCGMDSEDAADLVANGLTPVVWTAEHIEELEAAAAAAGVLSPVHLEIDSGMSRQGAAPGAALTAFLNALARAPHLRLEGVFSHLSSSEVRDTLTGTQTALQTERFGTAIAEVLAAGVRPTLLHLANTSALDEGSTTEWVRRKASQIGARVLVRPGFAVYGHTLPVEDPAGTLSPGQLGPGVEPVLVWKTRVIGTRDLQVGETVGYGATFRADRAMRLALLPVGYADGFRREASSSIGDGWVVIASQRAPVVGRVSMNLTVVDVSNITSTVQTGDEAVLLGEGVSAEDHARWCRTIPYEILCGIRAHRRLV
jgi:alanine racemase